MKHAMMTVLVLLLLSGATACASKPKPKPLVPLPLVASAVTPQALALTDKGTQAYQAKQFEEAKNLFAQAVAAAPKSGHAHYNYGLALNALGDNDGARQHFLEAANLEPGDKTIWDSPALSPYGNPEAPKTVKEHPYGTRRPTIGSGPR